MLDRPYVDLQVSLGTTYEGAVANSFDTLVHQHLKDVKLEKRGCNVQANFRTHLPLHFGLGSGTQHACSIASALGILDCSDRLDLSEANGRPVLKVLQQLVQDNDYGFETAEQWLVERSGRCRRSAIGLTGFLQGGLIFDFGHQQQSHSQRQLKVSRVDFPSMWRIVLIQPPPVRAVYGVRESSLMRTAAQTPNRHVELMLSLAQACQSAARATDFSVFTAGLDEYMGLTASLFMAVQGGKYNGPEVALAVEMAKTVGLHGVGQSSWGPTVFGFARSENDAHAAVTELSDRCGQREVAWQVLIAKPKNEGAIFRMR